MATPLLTALNFLASTGDILQVSNQTALKRISASGGLMLGHDDGLWLAAGETSTLFEANLSPTDEIVHIGGEGGVRFYSSPNNWDNGTTGWANRNEMIFGTNGVLSINGNTVWHAGNDGAASGLDADLLDGQHGSYYLDTSSTNQTKVGAITLNNYLYVSYSDPRIIFYETDAAAEWKRHDWINQNGYFVGRFYNDAGTASHTWLTVARAAASPVATSITLNAATVSITGALTVSSTLNAVGAITQNGSQVLHAGNYNTYAPTLTGTGASGTWGISISGNAATATLAGKMTTLLANDGAALPGSYYSLGGSFVSFLSSTGGSASNYPAEGDGGGAGIVVHRDNDANGTPATGSFQLWASTGQDNTVNNLWFRKYGLTTGGGGTRSWGSWVKLFHSGNSGTGSLLDADKLDGQEGSYYLDTSSNAQTKAGTLTLNSPLNVSYADPRVIFYETGAAVGSKRADWINQSGAFVGRLYNDDGTSSHTWLTVARAAGTYTTGSITLNAPTTSVTGNLSITGGVGAIAMHVVNGRVRFGHASGGSGVWFDGDGSDYLWFAGLTGTSFRLWNNNVNRLILTTGGALTVPGAATFGSATISTSLTVNTSLTVLGGGTFRNGTAGQSVNIGPLDSGQTGNAGALNLYTGAGNHWHQVVRGDQHPSAPNWWSLFYYDGVFNTALVINTSREFGFGGNPATGYRVSVSGNTYMAGDLVIGSGYEIRASNGSAGTPTYSFSSDPDTGMFWAGTNILGFSTAANERMRITQTGTVQIASTTAPLSGNCKLLVGAEWTGSAAIAQFGGFLRADFLITHNDTNGIYPNVNNTGAVGNLSARYAIGYLSKLNIGTHGNVPDTGSGTSLQVGPNILSGDLYGVGDAQSNSWNWLQGLVTGMGYPDSPAILGAFQNNLLANWVRRGGSASTSVSGGASWSNPSNTYEPPFFGKHRARSHATLANATGTPNTLTIELTDPQTTQSSSNSLVYTFTNMTLWVPYVVFRTTANITNIKVEINVGSDNTTPGYQTIFDAAPQFVKSTLWRGPVFRPTSGGYALFGIKFTFTHAGGGTSAEILEIGLADNWGIHGRHMWASPWATQTWTAQQTFSVTPYVGANQIWHAGNDGSGSTLDADLFDGVQKETLVSCVRSAANLTGGGVVTLDSSWNLKWTKRFIVIANGRGSLFGTAGYFDIDCPPDGTSITGVGGAATRTATAAGVFLNTWEALYYILPIGGSNTSNPSNFRICKYTSDVSVPENWVLLAVRNTDTDSTGVRLGTGVFIQPSYSLNIQRHMGMCRYALTIGDGYATSYNVDHNFGTKDVHVQIVRVSDGAIGTFASSIVASTINRVVVTFASAPTTNQYRVVVIG